MNKWVKGVARANRSICIISASGQWAVQGSQWVQGKAVVGGPGGLATGFYIARNDGYICISKMATPGRLQFSYDLYRRYHS